MRVGVSSAAASAIEGKREGDEDEEAKPKKKPGPLLDFFFLVFEGEECCEVEPDLGRATDGSREKASSAALAEVVSSVSPRLVEWDGRVRLP